MYFVISFICNNKEYFCIWFSDEDEYILSKDSRLISFTEKNALLTYVCENNISLENEDIVQYNVDDILMWCKDSLKLDIECDKFIDFWNICADAAKGMNVHFIGTERKFDSLYEKIFLGNNITNASSQEYIPIFSDNEIKTLKSIFTDGIELIKNGLSKG